jgi:hypothetical protein
VTALARHGSAAVSQIPTRLRSLGKLRSHGKLRSLGELESHGELESSAELARLGILMR